MLLDEVHRSKFSILSGENNMYKYLQEDFMWQGMDWYMVEG